MQNFEYRARGTDGKLVTGQVQAEDPKSARKKISSSGLIAIQLKASKAFDIQKFVSEKWRDFTQGVKIEDLMMFSRQMQIIYAVGIPILHGMKLLHEQTANPLLKKAIAEMTDAIADGSTFFAALEKQSHIFDPVYINLVKIGEASGQLQVMLEKASSLIEKRSEQREKVKSATFYPKMVFGFFAIVLFVVVYLVLPRLKSFFTGLGADLPLITQIVMNTSDAFVEYWYLVIAIGAGIYFGYQAMLKNPVSRYWYDSKLIKLPVLGPLLLQIEINTFCVLLEVMLESGVPILEAFRFVAKSLTNMVVEEDVMACQVIIEKGGSLATGLENAKAFPKLVAGLLAIGEEGGSLPSVLKHISNFYKTQVDYKLNNLSKLIEPILLFVIFGIVLILALAVFMPMWKMSSALKK